METHIHDDTRNFTGIHARDFESSKGDNQEENNEEESYFNLKRPQTWCECFSILWKKPEEKVLLVQNPDGLLYLSYLKYCGQLFSLCKSIIWLRFPTTFFYILVNINLSFCSVIFLNHYSTASLHCVSKAKCVRSYRGQLELLATWQTHHGCCSRWQLDSRHCDSHDLYVLTFRVLSAFDVLHTDELVWIRHVRTVYW